eukprot:5751426-Alexandrium_andersonii.AAC.1
MCIRDRASGPGGTGPGRGGGLCRARPEVASSSGGGSVPVRVAPAQGGQSDQAEPAFADARPAADEDD